jgi:Fic family protein
LVVAQNTKGSNSIEGIHSSVDDVLAVMGNQTPQETTEADAADIRGYQQAMTYVLELSNDATAGIRHGISSDFLCALHFMLTSSHLEARPGRPRLGQVYVVDESNGETLYEAPKASQLPKLMDELTTGVNLALDEATDGNIVTAAMAHFNCVAIHPFKDGNGRVSRILQSFVLGQTTSTVPPEFMSVEEYLGAHTSDYYAILQLTHGRAFKPKTADTRAWVRFILDAHVEQATLRKQQAIRAEHVWSRLLTLQGELPVLSTLERALPALFDAICGIQVRTSTYVDSVTESGESIAEQTATRDIRRLLDAGLLVSHGQTRGRFYTASEYLMNAVL